MGGQDFVAVSQFAEEIGAAKQGTGRKWVQSHFLKELRSRPGKADFPDMPAKVLPAGKGGKGAGKGGKKGGKGKGGHKGGQKKPWEFVRLGNGSLAAAVPLSPLREVYCP